MKVTPLTEKEIKELNNYPEGEYDFEITNAIDHVSKSSGNESIKATVRIYDGMGGSKFVDDYISESSNFGKRKLRHLCQSLGLLDKYNSGGIEPSDLVGKSGRCSLVIQVDKDGKYADKNSIIDYIYDEQPPEPKTMDEVLKDDSIPF